MKKHLLALATVAFLCSVPLHAQVTVHYWNFNVGQPGTGENWASPIAANIGSGSLTHNFDSVLSFAGTTVNAEVGDPSGGSLCPIGLSNNGNEFVLSIPTTGYVSPVLSYATRGTSTGFQNQEILYSLDGSTFTSFTNITGITTTFELKTVDFSGVTGANENPNFKIKFIVTGATGTSGNNRFDNVKLRGFLPGVNNGDGSATLVNNAGTFLGSTVFSRNTGGQTVMVSVSGVPGGNLDQVRLTVPSGWTGLSAPNVTVGGAFSGNTPVVGATQITINSAALGTTAGTIQISSLTSPNPIGALNNGNSIWTVETAVTAGTLTPIASSPASHTIIPIENIRTGGVDGFGNSDAGGLTSAMNGQVVAVQGIATVQNQIVSANANQTSFFIQQGGFGLQVFRNSVPTVTWVRGDDLVIRGIIETFDGSTEVVPQTGGAPDFYNIGSGALPSPFVLPNANSISEAHEGKLVSVNSVTWDSAGLTFTSSVGARNSFRTAPTDTGTLFMTATNPLVGTTIPASSNVTGIIYHRNGITGPVVPPHKLVARDLVDLGFDPADGTGTAAIAPLGRIANQTAVAETLTIAGNGTNTLGGASVTIPSSWTWNGSSYTLSGAGFGGATSAVTGNGSGGNPWVITVNNAAVTDVNTGIIRIFNLGTPSTTGPTTFITKTRGASGTLANIASQPIVNIGSSFEAVASGNWSSPATWAGGVVPTATDDVTMSTLQVTVTIDITNAACNNLTMIGTGTDTTGGGSGPVLKFVATGTPQLTVNGDLSVSGGSGGGNGNRGGRAQLTSNGNTAASLVVKKNLFCSSSNTVANGNAGMNMHEGTVKMTGSTSDTLRFGASMRLGNLEIGDGSSAKTVSTAFGGVATSATANVKSLMVKQGSTLLLGTDGNTFPLTVGNAAVVGIPFLDGGITVESGATIDVQLSTAGEVVANINLNGGGITNNGSFSMLSFALARELTHCRYNVVFGTTGTTSQTVGGSNAGSFADVTVSTGHTVTLQRNMNILDGFKMALNGTLAENAGRTVVGAIEATRDVQFQTVEAFGGMGIELVAMATAPGPTLVRRVTGVASSGGTNTSILRYFDATPTINSGLNATLRYFYDNTELAGQNPLTLQLWKSINNGISWTAQGGTVDTTIHRIQVTGLDGLSRWTASDADNPLTGGGGTVTIGVPVAVNWNIVSLPVSAPIPNDSVRNLYVNSTNPYAFAFQGGYVQRFVMANGPGYWIKSSQTYTQNITGTQRDTLTVPVLSGWNMIGSISTTIDTSVAQVTPSVSGLRASNYFRYSNGYLVATTIQPGAGYWVKANSAGSFFMHVTGPAGKAREPVVAGRSIEDLNTLIIKDASGGSQTLYFGSDANNEIPVPMFAMPPAPPTGSFDARFESSDGGLMVQTHAQDVTEAIDMPVAIQPGAYPLMVSWKIRTADASYELSDGAVSHAMRGEGTLKITNSGVQQLVLKVKGSNEVPAEFALSQNYPNPFNPTTSIKFALPVESRVTVEVFNLLGQRVRTLVSGIQPAGYHVAEWNGTNDAGAYLASGMYFLRLAAEGNDADGATRSFSDVRKLMMLK